jgi:hypothetical protein
VAGAGRVVDREIAGGPDHGKFGKFGQLGKFEKE